MDVDEGARSPAAVPRGGARRRADPGRDGVAVGRDARRPHGVRDGVAAQGGVGSVERRHLLGVPADERRRRSHPQRAAERGPRGTAPTPRRRRPPDAHSIRVDGRRRLPGRVGDRPPVDRCTGRPGRGPDRRRGPRLTLRAVHAALDPGGGERQRPRGRRRHARGLPRLRHHLLGADGPAARPHRSGTDRGGRRRSARHDDDDRGRRRGVAACGSTRAWTSGS